MSENQYIKKRQRLRNKPFVTTKAILLLIALSAFIYLGFYSEYGSVNDSACEGDCESLYSIWTLVLAFILMFAGIIAAGALVGSLVAKFNRQRNAARSYLYQQGTDEEEKS